MTRGSRTSSTGPSGSPGVGTVSAARATDRSAATRWTAARRRGPRCGLFGSDRHVRHLPVGADGHRPQVSVSPPVTALVQTSMPNVVLPPGVSVPL